MAYINELNNRNHSSENDPNPIIFLHIDYEQEITYEYLNPNLGSASGNLETNSETWF
jgi:hypothetical protein